MPSISYSYAKLEAHGPMRAVNEGKTVTNSLMKKQSFIAKLHCAVDYFFFRALMREGLQWQS